MKRKVLIVAAIVIVIPLVAFRATILQQTRFVSFALSRRQGCAGLTTSGPPQLQVLPTRYVADRWFATPVTTQGDTLLLFLDSGGGGGFASKPVLERLGFNPKFMGVEEGDSIFTGGEFPSFKPGAGIPAPLCAKNLDGF